MLGLVAELSGSPNMIDICTQQIPGWESAGKAAEDKGTGVEGDVGGETKSTLDKVLTFIGDAIDLVCSYKIKLICTLTGKARRFRRLLLQGKVSKTGNWWNPVDVWNDVQKITTKITSTIVSGTKAIGNKVVDGVKWVGKEAKQLAKYIGEKLKTIFKPVMDLFDKIKTKIVHFITTNPTIQKALAFFKCMLSNGAVRAILTLIKVIKGFITLIPTLATPAGWVQLLVNLICGWKDLRDGIKFLGQGFSTTDMPTKFNYFGKFTGRLLKAASGA